MKFQRPKGTYDIVPPDSYKYKYLLEKLDRIAQFYGFHYIETPIIEKTELFQKSIGEATDIVEKEMYSFTTKGGDNLTLRPEGTAPVVRAYIENGLKTLSHPIKLYYAGPFFRHENPQRLRYREFRQFGFEIIGADSSISDTEIIFVIYNFLKDIGINEAILHINSVGCTDCRQNYLSNLIEYIKPFYHQLPKEAKDKVKRNILKIFDLKDDKVKMILKQAPQIIDFLCDECKKNLEEILDYLDYFGFNYELDSRLVRGIDYYTKTVYEFYDKTDSSIAFGGGGRYDFLVKSLGGPDRPATGAALGVERILEILSRHKITIPKQEANVFIAHLGDLGRKYAFKLVEQFRQNNIPVIHHFGKLTLKSQLKSARKYKISYIIICAQKELLEDKVIVRDLKNGVQSEIKTNELLSFIQK